MAPPPSRVFIVDDHAIVRELLSDFLNDLVDLEVCGSAASGEEALQVLPHADCDLALVDVSMPGMDGIELVRRLQQEHPTLRCLMLSGHAEEVYVRASLEAGALGYVMKGDPDALREAIAQALSGGIYLSPKLRESGWDAPKTERAGNGK